MNRCLRGIITLALTCFFLPSALFSAEYSFLSALSKKFDRSIKPAKIAPLTINFQEDDPPIKPPVDTKPRPNPNPGMPDSRNNLSQTKELVSGYIKRGLLWGGGIGLAASGIKIVSIYKTASANRQWVGLSLNALDALILRFGAGLAVGAALGASLAAAEITRQLVDSRN